MNRFAWIHGARLRRKIVCVVFIFFSASVHAQSINIERFGAGIVTGTKPFNVSGLCTEPGDDCSGSDNRIRTSDTQSHYYSVEFSDVSAQNSAITSIVVEHTIHPNAGAVLEYKTIPSQCLSSSESARGDAPLSNVILNADESITLYCNLGSIHNDNLESLVIDITPTPESKNGSTFSTSVTVSGLDADGNVITASNPQRENVFRISTAPAWDLIGDRQPIYNAIVGARDMGTGRGVESGFYVYTTAHLAADASTYGRGLSELIDRFTFDFDLNATASDSLSALSIEAEVVHCLPNTFEWNNTVFGSETVLPNKPVEQKVSDSGRCTFSGDPVNGYTFLVENTDTAVTRYPTQSAGGQSLTEGPFFTMAQQILFFIPFSEVNRENEQPGVGAISITQCFNNFDSIDTQGVSNYGAAQEPTHNNCSGPLPLTLRTGAEFNHRAISRYDANNQWGYDPYITANHSGDGMVEAGEGYAYFNYLLNTGSVAWNNPMQCTTFDNSTQKITDRSNIGHVEGGYAFVRFLGGMEASEWQIEYASVDQSNVDPLDGNGDGVVDFNAASNRYEGNWNTLQNFRCDTPGVVWHTDPHLIGIDNVNAVRLITKDSTKTLLNAGENPWLIVPLEARSTFFGGPYAGSDLPAGTVLVSTGNHRADEYLPDGVTNTYLASPENDSIHGDRMTFVSQVVVDREEQISLISTVDIDTAPDDLGAVSVTDVVAPVEAEVEAEVQAEVEAEVEAEVQLEPDSGDVLENDENSEGSSSDVDENFSDFDSDNDGIPNLIEGAADFDFDGIPDFLDNDSDNDGIDDSLEGAGDADLDGIPDYLDSDADNDGIPDSVEGTADSDSRGVPDYLDVDSDGDGVLDAVEGNIDSDGDGLANYLDIDSDNDGILDQDETSLAVENDIDSDEDGVPDYIDLDSDNDGVLDSVETNMNSDGDRIPDYLDLDSDNDGITDLVESGGIDTDGDGRIDDFLDSNNDGLDDGIAILPLQNEDLDGDGFPNRLDIDSDNDNTGDLIEAGGIAFDDNADGVVDDFVDNNNDGLDDGFGIAPIQFEDSDNNGIADHLDGGADQLGQVLPEDSLALGTSSSGCRVAGSSRSGSIDPALIIMVGLALIMICRSRTRKLKTFEYTK